MRHCAQALQGKAIRAVKATTLYIANTPFSAAPLLASGWDAPLDFCVCAAALQPKGRNVYRVFLTSVGIGCSHLQCSPLVACLVPNPASPVLSRRASARHRRLLASRRPAVPLLLLLLGHRSPASRLTPCNLCRSLYRCAWLCKKEVGEYMYIVLDQEALGAAFGRRMLWRSFRRSVLPGD